MDRTVGTTAQGRRACQEGESGRPAETIPTSDGHCTRAGPGYVPHRESVVWLFCSRSWEPARGFVTLPFSSTKMTWENVVFKQKSGV